MSVQGSPGARDPYQVAIPVGDKWREWLRKYSNSIPPLVGASVDTRRAVLTLSLETLLGIQGSGGGGEASKVQLVDAQGNPLAVTDDTPKVLGVEVANDSLDVDVQQSETEPLNVRLWNNPSSQLQVGLEDIDGGVLPIRMQVDAIKAALPEANPLPVKVTNPSTVTGRKRYGRYVEKGAVANMTAAGIRIVVPTGEGPAYNVQVNGWIADDSVALNAIFSTMRIGIPVTTAWSGDNKGSPWVSGSSSQIGISDVRTATGAGTFWSSIYWAGPANGYISGRGDSSSPVVVSYEFPVIAEIDAGESVGFYLYDNMGNFSTDVSVFFSATWEE